MFGVKYNLILLVKDLLGGVGGLLLLLYQTGTEAGLLVLFGADEICRAERRKAGMTT